MELLLRWKGGIASEVVLDNGARMIMDGSTDLGGKDEGFRPMQVVICGLMGCSAVDVVMILNKMQQKFDNLQIKATAVRSDEVPAVFTDVHLHFMVQGEDVSLSKVERAVALSVEKYCSVSAMLRQSVQITHSAEVQ